MPVLFVFKNTHNTLVYKWKKNFAYLDQIKVYIWIFRYSFPIAQPAYLHKSRCCHSTWSLSRMCSNMSPRCLCTPGCTPPHHRPGIHRCLGIWIILVSTSLACVAGGLSRCGDQRHGRHFERVADGRLRASDKIAGAWWNTNTVRSWVLHLKDFPHNIVSL